MLPSILSIIDFLIPIFDLDQINSIFINLMANISQLFLINNKDLFCIHDFN